jgi:hypothetical protein
VCVCMFLHQFSLSLGHVKQGWVRGSSCAYYEIHSQISFLIIIIISFSHFSYSCTYLRVQGFWPCLHTLPQSNDTIDKSAAMPPMYHQQQRRVFPGPINMHEVVTARTQRLFLTSYRALEGVFLSDLGGRPAQPSSPIFPAPCLRANGWITS